MIISCGNAESDLYREQNKWRSLAFGLLPDSSQVKRCQWPCVAKDTSSPNPIERVVLRQSVLKHSLKTMFAFPARISILLWIFSTAAYASVTIANGSLNGVTDNDNGIEKFLGIPFAEPAVGDRRLRQAAPLGQSFGTLEADDFGLSCISARDEGPESEDCLTLNIWRPASAAQSNVSLPVLVWLYGGSLTSGSTVGSRSANFALATTD